MSIEIRALSFNVAGAADMQARSPTIDEAVIHDCYEKRTKETFEKIVSEFVPAIMCLQEVTRSEHRFLIELLESKGFTVLQRYGNAVCFRNEQFSYVDHQMTVNDDTGALFADLSLKGTKKRIRVVSSHLLGFNVTKLAKSPHTAEAGDNALKVQLATINSTKKVFDSFLSCFRDSDSPDLILFGLDANATAHFLPEKVHPERLMSLFEHGFYTDVSDTRATIIDDSTKLPYRYDYLFYKSIRGAAAIHNCEIEGINDTAILGNPEKAMSDHLPVLSIITIQTH